MLTRRELLALIGYSAVVKTVRAAEVEPFERIDAHIHIHRSVQAIFDKLEQTNWRGLNVCVCGPIGEEAFDLDGLLQRTDAVCRESKGRIAWAATFDARGFEKADFTERTLASVRRSFDRGAVGLKIWKNIGMEIRSKSGDYLMPDNKALLPIYELVQKEDRTLIAHMAEPNAAWLPLDANVAHSGFYKTHPESHMYSIPGAPKKEDILAARDRVMARFPKLRVVGCHFGSNEEDFKALSGRLDRYRNFVVDTAARVSHLYDDGRYAAVRFLEKYQDRIIYGTDFGNGPMRSLAQGTIDAQEVARSLSEREERDWDLFAGAGTVASGKREMQALALPEKILRKIFHDNAVRWIPGIAPSA